MPESPPTPAARPPRRWGRRITLALMSAVLLLAALVTFAWFSRVSLINHFLTDKSSAWRVRVEGLDWSGTGLRATGLSVAHADQTEPVFTAETVTSAVSWRQLKAGHLGAVSVENPMLHWRAGLRSDPPNPDKPPRTGPLVTWDSLQLTDGKVDVASLGEYAFTGTVSGQGGPGTWYHEGHLALSPQTLTVTEPSYQMTMESGPIGAVQATASELKLQGTLDAATGLLSLTDPVLIGTRLQFTPPSAPPAQPNEVLASDEGDRSIVTGVRLANLKAPLLDAGSLTPWVQGLRGNLQIAELAGGTELPFSFTGATLDQASAALPAQAALPNFSITAAFQNDRPQVDALTISGATVPDLAALLRQWGLAADDFPVTSFKADAVLTNLSLNAGLPSSTATQKLTLTDAKADLLGQGKVSAQRLTLHVVPDEIIATRRLRLLEILSPSADLILQSAAPYLAEKPAPNPHAPAAPNAAEKPLWEGWTADLLTITDGTFAATLPQAGNARVTTGVAISTTAREAAPPAALDQTPSAPPAAPLGPTWQVTLSRPQLLHPAFPTQPIALATAIQLTASAAGLWQKREIESLTVSGTQLQIGEALFRLVNALPPSPPKSEPPTTSQVAPPPPWRLGQLVLEDSLVQLDHLGDGRRLDVPIKRQEFRNLPLDATALGSVDRLYKIEVPNITLYNPWVEGQKAAVLDTNYIQFTPSGLLKRRLERVDLMLPSLYAGKALFDFVDATRQHFEKIVAARPEPSPNAPLLVDTSSTSPTTLSALASVTPSTAAVAAADWHIPFYTESGKVYVAPKGFPWPNLPVIPFRNARSPEGKAIPFLLRGETFHGELAIEPGWYDFPEYKLRLRLSDRGRIIFNTPQKDRDNNLTEVFENNTLIFRQLRIDEVWLSITYDASGIYAKFGGLTCGGTISGGFNLYLDELYTWDAWASMIGINMKPLTDKLTPDTFRMTGPVDQLIVKAYGDTTTLYQALLDLGVSKPGVLRILALDGIKEELATLGGISGDLGKIGLETVRDFAYTGCTGSLKLFGTEGTGHLHLTGPAGSRTFNLRLHDYRAKIPKSMPAF